MKKVRGVRLTPYEIFMRRCKRNLHILLVMSPDGNKLQNYFRKYPSLVNCTTIDWFLNWPTEALKAVSDHYLVDQEALLREVTMMISEGGKQKPKEPQSERSAKVGKKGLATIAENEQEKEEEPASSHMVSDASGRRVESAN